MEKFKNIKRVFASVLVTMMMVTMLPIGSFIEAAEVNQNYIAVSVKAPTPNNIKTGATVEYVVNYTNATKITLKESDVTLLGFTGNIMIVGGGNAQRKIVISNIQGESGKKYIKVAAGTANGQGSAVNSVASFTLEKVTTPGVVVTPGDNTVNGDTTTGNNGSNNTKPTPDTTKPGITVGHLSATSVVEGGTLSYVVTYSDNVGIKEINLKNSDITLVGFSANIMVTGSGNTRTVTLSNIQGTKGDKKGIKVAAGTASDAAGNKANAVETSNTFVISPKPVNPTPNPDPKPEQKPDKPSDWIPNPNTGK